MAGKHRFGTIDRDGSGVREYKLRTGVLKNRNWESGQEKTNWMSEAGCWSVREGGAGSRPEANDKARGPGNTITHKYDASDPTTWCRC